MQQRMGSYSHKDWKPLHREIRTYRHRLVWRANAIDTRRGSMCCQWKAKGSQKMLRNVARQLGEFCRLHPTSYVLSLALRDYAQILEKCLGDAREEASGRPQGKGVPLAMWKAAGEARVLPRVVQTLWDSLEQYADTPAHILAADGKRVIRR